ncbi:hypothetical protein R1flu_016071 [Riccia fluitans]|uniref:Uncharacterized protein n=1 Tax=Riccia fluitans TaxID=41844 RepID=A0ABD1YL08_9MARC
MKTLLMKLQVYSGRCQNSGVLQFEAGTKNVPVGELRRILQDAVEKEFTGMKKTCEGLEANSDRLQTTREFAETRSSSSSTTGTPDSIQDKELPYSMDDAAVTGCVEVRATLEASSSEKKVETIFDIGDGSQLHKISNCKTSTADCNNLILDESRNKDTNRSIQNKVPELMELRNASSLASHSWNETCSSDVQRWNDEPVFSDESYIKQNLRLSSESAKFVDSLVQCSSKHFLQPAEKTRTWDVSSHVIPIKPGGRAPKGSAFDSKVLTLVRDQEHELDTMFDSSVNHLEGVVFTLGDTYDELVNHEEYKLQLEPIHSMDYQSPDISCNMIDYKEASGGVSSFQQSTVMERERSGENCSFNSEVREPCASDREVKSVLKRYGEGKLDKMIDEDLSIQVKLRKVNTRIAEPVPQIDPQEDLTYNPLLRTEYAVDINRNCMPTSDAVDRVLDETPDGITDSDTENRPIMADKYFQEYCRDQKLSEPEVLHKVVDKDLIKDSDNEDVEPSITITTHEYFQEHCRNARFQDNTSTPMVLDKKLQKKLVEAINYKTVEQSKERHEYFQENCDDKILLPQVLDTVVNKATESDESDESDDVTIEKSITAEEYFREYGQNIRSPHDTPTFPDLGVVSLKKNRDLMETTDHRATQGSITAKECFQRRSQNIKLKQDSSRTDDLRMSLDEALHVKSTARGVVEQSISAYEYFQLYGEQQHKTTSEVHCRQLGESIIKSNDHEDLITDKEESIFSTSTFSKLEKAAATDVVRTTSNKCANWDCSIDSTRTSSGLLDVPIRPSTWLTFFDRLLCYGKSVTSSRRNTSLQPVPRVLSNSSVLSKLADQHRERSSLLRSTTPALLGLSGQQEKDLLFDMQVKVVIRMRPFADHEKTCPMKQILCLVPEDTVMVKENSCCDLLKCSGNTRSKDERISEFRVDKVVDDSFLLKHQWEKKADSQKWMFELIGLPCLKYTLDGYNTTVNLQALLLMISN